MNTQPEPIERLIGALIGVTTAAETLGQIATRYAGRPDLFRKGVPAPLSQALSALRRSIGEAIRSVPGVHVWIPPDAGIQPRQWTTGLCEELNGFHSLIVSVGCFAPIESQDSYIAAVNRISKRIGFLEALDLSGFDPAKIRAEESSERRSASDGDSATRGMSVPEANMKARELADADPTFVSKTADKWAKEIGCSKSTVHKTTVWKLTMEQTGRGRKNGRAKPKVFSLPKDDLLKGRAGNDPLDCLIAEQEADLEPSSADPDPSLKPPRTRKQF